MKHKGVDEMSDDNYLASLNGLVSKGGSLDDLHVKILVHLSKDGGADGASRASLLGDLQDEQ